MHPLLTGFSFAGMLQSNQVYLFLDSANGSKFPINAKHLYGIRNDQELIESLSIELKTLDFNDYRLLNFLGVQRLSHDCYQFTIRVMDTDRNFEKLHHLYLHRLLTASEGIEIINDLYDSIETDSENE